METDHNDTEKIGDGALIPVKENKPTKGRSDLSRGKANHRSCIKREVALRVRKGLHLKAVELAAREQAMR